MESILDSIKILLGIEPEDTSFDNELIMYINSVFLIFYQIGVGDQSKVYHITGEDETWDDFTGGGKNYEAMKTDMFMRVKLMFDSNSMSSGLVSEFNDKIKEDEWRLNLLYES